MLRRLSIAILRLFGWRVEKTFPHHLNKFVLIVLPHTSNWDFPIGVLARAAVGGDIKFLAKNSLFRFPFGYVFKAMGGYPVDRSKSTNFVDAVIELFNEKKRFVVCMAPEGTRSKVDRLKSGFYYIAKGAGVPILMTKFDYGKKLVGFAEPFIPSDDYEETLARLKEYFKGVKGKRHELVWSEMD